MLHSNPSILQFDWKGAFTPPIFFREATEELAPQQAQQPQAVYIKAFNEIFTEIRKAEDRKTLLTQLNLFIAEHKTFEFFIDVPEVVDEPEWAEELETGDDPLSAVGLCILWTAAHLGANNYIQQLLLKQEKEKTDFLQFKLTCKKRGMETVYLGGVFGKACVWSAGRKMSETVYSKQLGDFHPNLRFVDLACDFRFKKAIIWPAITQGYLGEHLSFDQFLCFPPLGEPVPVKDLEVPGVFEEVEENLIANEPGKIGEAYTDLMTEDSFEREFYEEMKKLIRAFSTKQKTLYSSAFIQESFNNNPAPAKEVKNAGQNPATLGTTNDGEEKEAHYSRFLEEKSSAKPTIQTETPTPSKASQPLTP